MPLKLERLAQGLGRHEADLPGALKNTDPVGAPATPAQPAPATAPPGSPNPGPDASAATPPKQETSPGVATGDLGTPEDEQLTQALDVLRGLALVTARNSQ